MPRPLHSLQPLSLYYMYHIQKHTTTPQNRFRALSPTFLFQDYQVLASSDRSHSVLHPYQQHLTTLISTSLSFLLAKTQSFSALHRPRLDTTKHMSKTTFAKLNPHARPSSPPLACRVPRRQHEPLSRENQETAHGRYPSRGRSTLGPGPRRPPQR